MKITLKKVQVYPRMSKGINWDVIRKRINARAKQLSISRYVIAKYCNVNESTIKRVLDGSNVPSVNLYLRILEAVQLRSIIDEV